MKDYPKLTVMKIREEIFYNTLRDGLTARDRERLKKLYIFEGKYFGDSYTLSLNLKGFADYMLGCGYLYGFFCGIDIKTELSGDEACYKINIRLVGILLTLILHQTLIYGGGIGVQIKNGMLLIYTDFLLKRKMHLTAVLNGLNALGLFGNKSSKICVPLTEGSENSIIKNELEYYKNPFSVFNIFIK